MAEQRQGLKQARGTGGIRAGQAHRQKNWEGGTQMNAAGGSGRGAHGHRLGQNGTEAGFRGGIPREAGAQSAGNLKAGLKGEGEDAPWCGLGNTCVYHPYFPRYMGCQPTHPLMGPGRPERQPRRGEEGRFSAASICSPLAPVLPPPVVEKAEGDEHRDDDQVKRGKKMARPRTAPDRPGLEQHEEE